MKRILYLLCLPFFLLFPIFVTAEDTITSTDLAEAVEFAKNFYPIFTNPTWVVIDEDCKDLENCVFTEIRNNGTLHIKSPCCFLGKRNDKWYLLVNRDTIKEIILPEGYDIKSIISPNAYMLDAHDWSRLSALYNPVTKKFITNNNTTNNNLVTSYNNGIIVTTPIEEQGNKEKMKIIIFDDKCNIIYETPLISGKRITWYTTVGENLICSTSFLLTQEGKIDNNPKECKTALFNRNMNKICDLPNGWTFHCPYSDGTAVLDTAISKLDDPVQYAFIDKNGNFISKTNKEIRSGKNGYYCFMDLKTSLIGYVDKNGKEIIPAQFNNATDFLNGVAYVTEWVDGISSDESGSTQQIKCFEIDKKGTKLREIKGGFDYLPLLHRGIGIKCSGGEEMGGIFKLDGTPIWIADKGDRMQRCYLLYRMFF